MSMAWVGGTLEGGFLAGNGDGTKYGGVHASLRANVPVEDIVGIVYIGMDFLDIENINGEKISQGSSHLGGGIISPVVPGIWFRGDMKFNAGPGTSMYINFGLTFILGAESNS